METFVAPKQLVDNLDYLEQRVKAVDGFNDSMIDTPIVDLINAMNSIPICFTLQSCYGHFLYNGQNDPHNLDPLPRKIETPRVEYRVAYIALCIENNVNGRELLEALRKVSAIAPDNIQLFCAEWFWERQVNSYVLQVLPERYKDKDTAVLSYSEAIIVEKVRKEFFQQLNEINFCDFINTSGKQ